MPASLHPRLRQDGEYSPPAVRWRSWTVALLAALAVMLSHGLDSETPTEHRPAAAHIMASAGHGTPPPPCDGTVLDSTLAAPASDDSDGHTHGTHVCLTGHLPQGPSLPDLWPAPAAAVPAPEAGSTAARRMATAPAVGENRPAGSQVLRV